MHITGVVVCHPLELEAHKYFESDLFDSVNSRMLNLVPSNSDTNRDTNCASAGATGYKHSPNFGRRICLSELLRNRKNWNAVCAAIKYDKIAKR